MERWCCCLGESWVWRDAFGWAGMHGMDIRSFDNICAAAVSAALLFLVLLVWLLCCFSERHCWVFPWQCHMQLVIQRTCSYTLRPLSRLPIKYNGTMLFFIYALLHYCAILLAISMPVSDYEWIMLYRYTSVTPYGRLHPLWGIDGEWRGEGSWGSGKRGGRGCWDWCVK